MISGIILYLMSISAVPNILSYPLEKGKLSLEKNNLKDVDGHSRLASGAIDDGLATDGLRDLRIGYNVLDLQRDRRALPGAARTPSMPSSPQWPGISERSRRPARCCCRPPAFWTMCCWPRRMGRGSLTSMWQWRQAVYGFGHVFSRWTDASRSRRSRRAKRSHCSSGG